MATAKTSSEITKFPRNIEHDLLKQKRRIREVKRQYSPLVLCFGYYKYCSILIKFINRTCIYGLIRSSTVKASTSFISSRIFSTFGVGKDFRIISAFSFRKPQQERVVASRFLPGLLGWNMGYHSVLFCFFLGTCLTVSKFHFDKLMELSLV